MIWHRPHPRNGMRATRIGALAVPYWQSAPVGLGPLPWSHPGVKSFVCAPGPIRPKGVLASIVSGTEPGNFAMPLTPVTISEPFPGGTGVPGRPGWLPTPKGTPPGPIPLPSEPGSVGASAHATPASGTDRAPAATTPINSFFSISLPLVGRWPPRDHQAENLPFAKKRRWELQQCRCRNSCSTSSRCSARGVASIPSCAVTAPTTSHVRSRLADDSPAL
jgi:hypothetical protein